MRDWEQDQHQAKAERFRDWVGNLGLLQVGLYARGHGQDVNELPCIPGTQARGSGLWAGGKSLDCPTALWPAA